MAIVLEVVLLAGLAGLLAWILRRANISGGRAAASVVGGVMAGVLAGPAVLGEFSPRLHRQLCLGAVSEQGARASVLRDHAAERAAAVRAGLDAEALRQIATRQAQERARVTEAVRGVERRRADACARVILGVLCATMFVGPLCSRWGDGRRDESIGAFAAAGLGASAVEGLLLLGAVTIVLSADPAIGLCAAAIGASGSAIPAAPLRRRPAGARTAGTQAFLLAMFGGAMLLASVTIAWRDGLSALWMPAGVVGAIAAGTLLSRWARVGRAGRRAALAAITLVGVPLAAAYAASRVDWGMIGSSWKAMAVLAYLTLFSGAGILMSAALLKRGRRWLLWARDGAASGYGPTRVLIAATLLAAGAVDPTTALGSAVLAGGVLGACVNELLASQVARPEPSYG